MSWLPGRSEDTNKTTFKKKSQCSGEDKPTDVIQAVNNYGDGKHVHKCTQYQDLITTNANQRPTIALFCLSSSLTVGIRKRSFIFCLAVLSHAALLDSTFLLVLPVVVTFPSLIRFMLCTEG